MIFSVGANKKRIVAVLLLIVLAVGAFFLIPKEPERITYPGMTNEERIAFLSSFDWIVEEEPVDVREVVIPAEFDDVYSAYNQMQNAQGFDLKAYAGEKCTQYRYFVKNYPGYEEGVIATLLVFEDCIVGGDVAAETENGFMHGFAANSAHFVMPEQAA